MAQRQILLVLILAAAPGFAAAQDVVNIDEPLVTASATPIADSLAREAAKLAQSPQDDVRPLAIEYSEGHETRAKIHKYVSWATLPLIGTEFWLGQRLYDNPNGDDDLRGVHGAVGAGLIGLFAVQSVTGVWNLVEGRGAPGHKKRLTHGLIMLAAEGGFVAAAAMAPGHSRNGVSFDADRSAHRTVALVSMGVGTAGYLWMLLTGGGR